MLHASFRLPSGALFVGKNTSGEGRAVVTTQSDEHDAKAGHFQVCPDGVFKLGWGLNFFLVIPQRHCLGEFRQK